MFQKEGYPLDWLQELKEKNNIVEVISRYVQLQLVADYPSEVLVVDGVVGAEGGGVVVEHHLVHGQRVVVLAKVGYEGGQLALILYVK